MSNAWETTTDDIDNVLRLHGIGPDSFGEAGRNPIVGKQGNTPIYFSSIESVSDALDHEQIEEAALAYNEFENQCSAAYVEIERQLVELGVLDGPGKVTPPDDEDDDDAGEDTQQDDGITLLVGDKLTVTQIDEDQIVLYDEKGERKFFIDRFAVQEWEVQQNPQKPELNVGPFPQALPFVVVDVNPERNE